MEWKKTRFAGCEVKGLLFDKETGLVTALMKFAPGCFRRRLGHFMGACVEGFMGGGESYAGEIR